MPISRLGGSAGVPSLGDVDDEAPTGVEPALATDAIAGLSSTDATVPESPAPADPDAFGARPNSFSELRPVTANAYQFDAPVVSANALRYGAPSGLPVRGSSAMALADAGEPATEAAAALVPTEAELPAARAVDVDKAAAFLDRHAQGASTHKCATFVRRALEAGGFDSSGHPVDAKDYGPFLLSKGYHQVDRSEAYSPRKGDVVVLQPTKTSSTSGHVTMYDGKQWVSDFRQKDFWGGPAYRDHAAYAVYRP